MKKQVLLSVFAAAVFAAPTALAVESSTDHNGTDAQPGYFFGPGEKEIGAGAAADLAKSQTASQIKKVEEKNHVTVDKNGVLREKGKKPMAPAAKKAPAGHKALPKTSAAK